jgi:sulfotransferase
MIKEYLLPRHFFFLAGLPRSGSTLLASILNQHPEVYSGPLSPIIESMYYTEKYFTEGSDIYASCENPEALRRVISGIPVSYYADIEKRFVIDKNRAWPNNIDLIKRYIEPDPKIICTVRSIPAILASFVHLIEENNNPGENFVDTWLTDNDLAITTENRCYYLMQPTGIVNQSLWAFSQAYEKKQENYLKIIEYDHLMENPELVLSEIINYLGIAPFGFDLTNINNDFQEDDMRVYKLKGMHSVRKNLGDRKLDPTEILGGDIIKRFSGLEFWRNRRPEIKGFYL